MITARQALAVTLPIGPLAVAIVRGILPYHTTDSSATVAARIAAHQGTESAISWLMLIAVLTIVPAVIAAGLFARQGAPRLGTIALVLCTAGFLSLFWSGVAGTDTVALAAGRLGVDPAVTGRLITGMGAITPVAIAGAIFFAGHVLGLLLLGIALWRGRMVPAWAGIVLAVSQPLHFLFTVVAPSHPLDACAWGLTTVGFAAVAATLLRSPAAREPANATEAPVQVTVG